MKIQIHIDDLSGEEAQLIVREHLASMYANTPIDSVHTLPIEMLRHSSVTFWTAWTGSELCGCGAIQTLDTEHAEIKSMRTRPRFLRQGIGQALLSHIFQDANARGFKRLSLETGSADEFVPARTMYLKNGFEICGPFGNYQVDPLSVFMTKILSTRD